MKKEMIMSKATNKTVPVSLSLSDEEKSYKGISAVDEREARLMEAVDQIEGENPLGGLLEPVSDETIAGILQGHLVALANEALTSRLGSIDDDRRRASDRYQETLKRNHLAEQIAANTEGLSAELFPPNTSVIVLAEQGRPEISGPTIVLEITNLADQRPGELRTDLFHARVELHNMPSYFRVPASDLEVNELVSRFGIQMASGGAWRRSGDSFRSGSPCIVRQSFDYAQVLLAERATSQHNKQFPGAAMQASATYRSLVDRGVHPNEARKQAAEDYWGGK